MKSYNVVKNGPVPDGISKIMDKCQGLTANNINHTLLDQDIEFIVVDLKECHGNANKFDKSAWLNDRNNQWNVNISAK